MQRDESERRRRGFPLSFEVDAAHPPEVVRTRHPKRKEKEEVAAAAVGSPNPKHLLKGEAQCPSAS